MVAIDISRSDSGVVPSHAEYLQAVRRRSRRQSMQVVLCQIGILAVVLGAWEFLTRIPWFAENTIYDPFFISQPSKIIARIGEWMVPGPYSIWPNLWSTLSATFLGLFVGAGSGFVVGLALAQNKFLARVLNPFIVTLNSMPRIAFVPLITMIFGLGIASKVVTAWFVVFFLLFFNTYKGSLSVQRELLDFCRTLGGSSHQILWRVRVPYAAAWTFAALPNAVSFALVGVVLSEFVGSATGMGYIMISALAALNATDMFAAITVLSVVGLALVYSVRLVEKAVLHWSAEFRDED
ncbi:NitT/TauT family transport system permease protein [Rhodoligotrophos appendicifer]|uniref:ABC transporter permease n=1 Tax=Rhodoligotrophos appendicifer TaxID=987056 RepID=UPI00118518EC|nr:ABC transporter permease [Rhodoligotrophos appendicifer]